VGGVRWFREQSSPQRRRFVEMIAGTWILGALAWLIVMNESHQAVLVLLLLAQTAALLGVIVLAKQWSDSARSRPMRTPHTRQPEQVPRVFAFCLVMPLVVVLVVMPPLFTFKVSPVIGVVVTFSVIAVSTGWGANKLLRSADHQGLFPALDPSWQHRLVLFCLAAITTCIAVGCILGALRNPDGGRIVGCIFGTELVLLVAAIHGRRSHGANARA
jgi:hypothetical protein